MKIKTKFLFSLGQIYLSFFINLSIFFLSIQYRFIWHIYKFIIVNPKHILILIYKKQLITQIAFFHASVEILILKILKIEFIKSMKFIF